MYKNNVLIKRIAISKSIGFLFGLGTFILMPYFVENIDLFYLWGLLFWYTLIGSLVGVYGVFTKIPILNISFPWWLRGAIIGAMMNLILVLLTYHILEDILISYFGQDGLVQSPFLFIFDGILLGVVSDFFATKLTQVKNIV
jgi:hypothetical protein